MFKFLKEKLKGAISRLSEGVEKEGKAEEQIIENPIEKEEKGFFSKLKEKIIGKESHTEEETYEKKSLPLAESQTKLKEEIKITPQDEKAEAKTVEKETELEKIDKKHKKEKKEFHSEEKKEIIPLIKKGEPKPEIKTEQRIQEKDEKKGFFEAIKEKIITTRINGEQFEKLFWEMEMALMENNVAVDVIDKIKNDLKGQLVEKPIRRTRVEETIESALKDSILGLFQKNTINLLNEIKNKKEKPFVIAFFGINGSGKTTSIAKIANMLKHSNISCALAAGDTFRAASIEQLQQHADKLGIRLIKHGYGSDPAAVAFDAIKHAQAKNIDVVLIDTAGRMQTNTNLIDEMKKIVRVAKPDLKIFVGESITGNDCVEQAKTFNETVGFDGIILSKADIDEKGGAAISVSYVTKKPILYFGVGQGYKDLEPFNQEKIMKSIGLA